MERAEVNDVLLSGDGVEPPQLETRQTSLVWSGRAEVSDFPFLQSVASTIVEAGPCNPTLGAESTMDICETHTWSPRTSLTETYLKTHQSRLVSSSNIYLAIGI